MDFELWWLMAVPLLFGLGWIAARVDIRQMLSERRQVPDSYFQGLTYLLNEQHDRAIDAFIEVAKLDPETTELHFALGSLFRRRGEIERAIRVHQSLLQRADLPPGQREMALHELGQDYLRAGMLDRAEAAFEQLKGSRYAPDALRALIRIREVERDWPRAIQAVQALQGLVDEPVPQAVHFHCEAAAAALAHEPPDLEAAHASLDAAAHASVQAQRGDDGHPHVRIGMMRAELARRAGDARGQRLQLESVLADHPDYAGLVAPALLANFDEAGRKADGLALLEAHYRRHPSLDLFNAIFQGLCAQRGLSQAWAFAREALQRNPSLLGLDRLLEAQVARQAETGQPAAGNVVALQSAGGESPASQGWLPGEDATLMRSLIHKHTQRLDRYLCRACGFKARRFNWQCPGCNAWETYAPRRLEELDA